ncbi:hypothetical protein HELRODRAFT_172124 [Helobdella robusta]|uniref:J domain-containing protein n=1 Tax=Helobdella robusta TaxID=6412 RepID=T1F520_HELRO|nr:hypothetical protein HELRODRAFT_172124 [Helobdella robusta]ESO05104.1 hypothetical protein HELRODRAFT_172124 [Helobdella robusta]
MPSFIDEVWTHFQCRDLYQVLSIPKSSTKAEIKKAYYRLSITTHPDKVDQADRSEATKKFQTLGKIYGILSDDNLRSNYDETGSIDDDSDLMTEDRDWSEYWRLLFPKISTKDIEKFEQRYIGSKEEKDDLIRIYETSKGDMEVILAEMLCSTPEFEQRYREIIDKLIENKELKVYKKYYKSEEPKKKKARLAKAAKEAKEAEKMLDEMKRRQKAEDQPQKSSSSSSGSKSGSSSKENKTTTSTTNDDDDDDGNSSLASMILKKREKNRANFDNLMDNLEKKYATKGNERVKKSKKK